MLVEGPELHPNDSLTHDAVDIMPSRPGGAVLQGRLSTSPEKPATGSSSRTPAPLVEVEI